MQMLVSRRNTYGAENPYSIATVCINSTVRLRERELKSHTSAFHFHMGLHSSYRTAG